jgi:chromate reductase
MKILIVTATRGNNLSLGEKIGTLLDSEHEIICLEDYPLPLFVPGGEKADNSLISELIEKFENSDGFIFCAPEYNAGIPPILTNVITWITVSTKNWRDAFNDKVALIASHSGGVGHWFFSSFRDQLEYMGCTVYNRSIAVHRNAEFNPESVARILTGFKKLF